MNVWIFQSQPGIDMFQNLIGYKENNLMHWNIDRYFRNKTSQPKVTKSDLVLFWQPECKNAPAGIYGYGKIKDEPYEKKNEKSNYKVDVEALALFLRPITKKEIINTNIQCLLEMQIIKMPGGHIVFKVTDESFNELCKNFHQILIIAPAVS